MELIFRHSWLVGLVALLVPSLAPADEATNDFVRAQAAKAAFVTDVGKINFMAGEMFRFGTYAVMRMTHDHWEFAEDSALKDHGQTYAYEVKSTADRTEYDARRAAMALSRNDVVSKELRSSAHEMVDRLDQLRQLSLDLAKLYDTGDVRMAGDHYYEKIVPVYEAIRRAEATISSELAREIKLDAATFRP